METKFFALYARVSTEEQSGSIVSQLQRLNEYLRYKGENLPILIYKEERSGKDTNRPEYQRLLSDIRAKKIHAVICTEISRISRSIIDFHYFLEALQENSVNFVSLKENFNTSTPIGKFMFSISACLAQFEREQISERTSLNMRARARRGLFNGGYVHYGYKINPDRKGILDIDEDEARIVCMIYEKYLEIGSYCQVVDYLNNKGYRTRKGKKWAKSPIYRMLRNPVYIGKTKADGKIVPSAFPGLITGEKWNAVQGLMDGNHLIRGNFYETSTYRFGGLLYCVSCSCFLESSWSLGRKGKQYYYYRHPSKGKKLCSLGSLPAKEIDEELCCEIARYLDDPELIQMVNEGIAKRLCADWGKREGELIAIKKEIESISLETLELSKKIYLFGEQHIKSIIAPRFDDLGERKSQLLARLQELESIPNEQVDPKDAKNLAKFLSDEFTKMPMADQKKVIRRFVERVDIQEDYSVVAYLRTLCLETQKTPCIDGASVLLLIPRTGLEPVSLD